MNAIQPSKPPLQVVEPRRVARPNRPKRRERPYRAIALETTVKLAVNVALSGAAVAALTQLLPYHWSVQDKLQEIREQVKQTQERVDRLKNDFSHTFDPQQAPAVMQKESNRVDPNRYPIVLLDNHSSIRDRTED